MKKALLLISLLLTITSNSQNTNEDNWGSWIMLYGTNRIADDFKIITEFRVHHFELFNDLDNQFIRTGLDYQLTSGISVTAGYIHQYSETLNDISVSENRPYEEITFKSNYKKFKIAHRYRIEHRWINKEGNTDFKHRLRYRFQIKHPLSERVYLMAMNELFLNLKESVFNQDRLQMGVGYVFSSDLKLELGYLKNYFSTSDIDIFRIGILFNTDLRKKSKPELKN
ncbi:DUF2490 domain-containing protein [Maribacter sp. HTCC2170]|uniref:DUF2490 domain-containing protein n=1 Tax=Maribacter sp. (strain HTCC2170 / KCCM 42371) TaxID=313603 RepID=UPI00006B47A7|nr:DUF2490 domain-containing protein [Maribacter sp. HTCC2170]EAR01666.1 hypothetical protein FB2170_14098 [Maribacter sp. HTCC2170]